jgi:hypothetical protein
MSFSEGDSRVLDQEPVSFNQSLEHGIRRIFVELDAAYASRVQYTGPEPAKQGSAAGF